MPLRKTTCPGWPPSAVARCRSSSRRSSATWSCAASSWARWTRRSAAGERWCSRARSCNGQTTSPARRRVPAAPAQYCQLRRRRTGRRSGGDVGAAGRRAREARGRRTTPARSTRRRRRRREPPPRADLPDHRPRVGFQPEPGARPAGAPARPASTTSSRKLRLVLLLLCAGGIALAAVLGRLAARRVLAPLAEVAQTAQHIEETEDLSSRIHVHADDEVGQLATRFNAMIGRLQHSRADLDESVRAQRQLVADASHELRTPITSLRTNIEVLIEQGDQLSDEDRRRLLADVLEQSEELSALIGDVIELARGDLPITSAEDVRLDRIVAESVARGQARLPAREIRALARPGGRRGRARAPRPRGQQPARQRRPPLRRGTGWSRWWSTRTASACATTAPGSTRPTSRTCSIASTGAPTRATARAAAWGWRSSARSPRSTAARSTRPTLPTVARCSRCACRPSRRSRPRATAARAAGRRPTRSPSAYAAALGGLASRAWRARRKRRRRNQAQAPNTAATGTSSSTRTAGVPTVSTISELGHHGRDRRQQDGVRAVAREVLAGGHLGHPEQAEDAPPISAGPPWRITPTISATDPAEDRELGDRQAAERAGRTLAIGAERARAARCAGTGCRPAGRSSRASGRGTAPRRGPARRDAGACASEALTSAWPLRAEDTAVVSGGPPYTRRRPLTGRGPSQVGSTRRRTRGTAR